MPDVKFSNQYPYTDFHELNLDWVIETVKHWADLVGKTIQSITLTGTTGLVDTYTINYSDGTTSTFNVTNGRGITSIVLTGSLDLVDTYTITYNDGSTSTFQITNGNGISSIEKTGTSGLIDTYTITFTDGSSTTFEVKNGAEALDATLSLAGYAADAKATGDALALKQNAADPAGLAENLTPYSPDSGATQSIPFNTQGTGCGNGESIVDTGSYAQVKKKLGNTVGVNMPIKLRTTSQYGLSASMGADGVITISGVSSTVYSPLWENLAPIVGHYYLLGSSIVANPNNISFSFGFLNCSPNKLGNVGTYDVKQIVTSSNSSVGIADFAVGTDFTGVKIRLFVVDISLWFGSNDRIPSDLLSHPENWGRYYAGSIDYNAGTLESADGTVLKSIGRNCFDGELESGAYNASTGTKIPNANTVRSKNLIPCIPNETYYFRSATALPAQVFYVVFFDAQGNFVGANINGYYNRTKTIPANAHFMGFWAGSYSYPVTDTSRKFTLSIYYTGESGYDKDYDYTVLAEVDTGSEVLRSAGAVADEKTPDGTITRRVGVVDLGTLTWTYENGVFYSTGMSAIAKPQQYPTCARYTAIDNGSDKSIYIGNSGITYVYDSSYTNAEAFQAAMNGIEMTYELLTPTTEQGTPFSGASADNFAIDDFGSMYWTQTNGVPQGVEIFYPVDYKAALDTLLNDVSGDVSKIVTTDTYPDVPTANGTYVLKAVVSGGSVTRSWVLE